MDRPALTFCSLFLSCIGSRVGSRAGSFRRESANTTAEGVTSTWIDEIDGQRYELTIRPIK